MKSPEVMNVQNCISRSKQINQKIKLEHNSIHKIHFKINVTKEMQTPHTKNYKTVLKNTGWEQISTRDKMNSRLTKHTQVNAKWIRLKVEAKTVKFSDCDTG